MAPTNPTSIAAQPSSASGHHLPITPVLGGSRGASGGRGGVCVLGVMTNSREGKLSPSSCAPQASPSAALRCPPSCHRRRGCGTWTSRTSRRTRSPETPACQVSEQTCSWVCPEGHLPVVAGPPLLPGPQCSSVPLGPPLFGPSLVAVTLSGLRVQPRPPWAPACPARVPSLASLPPQAGSWEVILSPPPAKCPWPPLVPSVQLWSPFPQGLAGASFIPALSPLFSFLLPPPPPEKPLGCPLGVCPPTPRQAWRCPRSGPRKADLPGGQESWTERQLPPRPWPVQGREPPSLGVLGSLHRGGGSPLATSPGMGQGPREGRPRGPLSAPRLSRFSLQIPSRSPSWLRRLPARAALERRFAGAGTGARSGPC